MPEANIDELSLQNLARPEIRADPYPFYTRIRTEDPVHWDEPGNFWVLTRYADAASAFQDARFSRAQGLQSGYHRLPENERTLARPAYDVMAKMMTYSDPPYHTRLRGLVQKAFTPRAVEQMEPHIQQIVDELLDAGEAKGLMEVMRDLAYPLPIIVIAEMLGLPTEDRAQFKQWSDDLFAIMGVVRHAPELMQKAAESAGQITDYINQLSEQRRQKPKDDLLSGLVAAEDEGSRLTHEELVANVVMLLAAGHETTTNLIGNGILALLRHPEEMEKLVKNPDLITSTIEEIMRYDNPVQIVYRSVTEDVEMDGKRIEKGQIVNLVVGSANRDPAHFSDPDHFDITRHEGRHVGLGLGIHFCLGAPLARLEGRIAINTLLPRFPQLELSTDKLQWHEHPTFRGVKELPVKLN